MSLGVNGLSFEKLMVIAVIAAFIIGPERLPEFAAWLSKAVKRVRGFIDDTKTQISDEIGGEEALAEIKKLDPRNYDPRRIIRQAWSEVDGGSGAAETRISAAKQRIEAAANGFSTPFDNEAT